MNCHRYETHFESEKSSLLCEMLHSLHSHKQYSKWLRARLNRFSSLTHSLNENKLLSRWSVLGVWIGYSHSILNRFTNEKEDVKDAKREFLCDWLTELGEEFLSCVKGKSVIERVIERVRERGKNIGWCEKGTQTMLNVIWASTDWMAHSRNRCDDMYAETLDKVACTIDSPFDRVKCHQIENSLTLTPHPNVHILCVYF